MATHARQYDSIAAPVLVSKPKHLYPHLLAVTVAAVLIRLWFLTDRNIWYDEAASISIAKLNWAGLWEVVTRKEANSALYFVLLKIWIAFGDSPAWVRGLSVAIGVATIPLLYLLGRRLFGRTAGFCAAVLLAVNPYHIRYSQETRGYALSALFAVASTLLFVRAVESPSWRKWALYTGVILAAVYTHFFGGLVMAAHYLSLLALPPRRWPWKEMLATAVIVLIAVIPLFLFISYRDVGQVSWIQRPGGPQIYSMFYDFSGPAGLSHLGRLTRLPQNMLLRIYGLLTAITLAVAVRAAIQSRRSLRLWPYVLVVLWMLVPIVLAIAISAKKPIFLARYLIVSLPAWTLLAGVGVAKLNRKWLSATAIGMVILLSMASNARPRANQFDPPYHQWGGATAYVLSHSRPGDGIVFYHAYGVLPFTYYRRQLGFPDNAGPELLYPFRSDGLVMARDEAIDYRQLWPNTTLFQRIRQHRRIWLVTPNHDDISQRLGKQIADIYPSCHQIEGFGLISMLLCERP